MRHPETMQSTVERDVANDYLRTARVLKARGRPAWLVRDVLTSFIFRRRVARAMRAPTQEHARLHVWAPLEGGPRAHCA